MMCLTVCEDVRAQLSHASLVIYMSRPELWRNQHTLCGPGLEEKGQFFSGLSVHSRNWLT